MQRCKQTFCLIHADDAFFEHIQDCHSFFFHRFSLLRCFLILYAQDIFIGSVCFFSEGIQDAFHDAAACLSVAEGVLRLRHFFVFLFVIQQFLRHGINHVFIRTCQLQGACFHTLEAFCYVAEHQNRLAHGGHLLLQTAAICHHEKGTAHKVMHIL